MQDDNEAGDSIEVDIEEHACCPTGDMAVPGGRRDVRPSGLRRAERKEVGRMTKRVIDQGRVEFLRYRLLHMTRDDCGAYPSILYQCMSYR